MNDNENKINGGEDIDRTPPSESEESQATRAFSWSYTDGDESASKASDESPAEANGDTPDEALTEEHKSPEESATESEDEQDTERAKEAEADPAKGNKESDEGRRSTVNPALIIATAMSGCAIILLLSIVLVSALGLFPSGNGNVVFIPVASPSTPEDHEISSDMLEEFMDSVVIIKAYYESGGSVGTGIVISENGYIVTNHHVIENSEKIYVWLYGEETPLTATVIGFKEMDDIAVLKINKTGLRPATFAKSSQCRVGERVYAVGTPEGDEFGWSVTQGIISCPLREIKLYKKDGTLEKKMNVIQTDASVNPGNSGGPLINSRGEVVGIITLKLSNSAGMGFALPSDGTLFNVESIIRKGHANDVNSGISVGRPLIGITGVGVQAETWYENVMQDGALSIKEVTEIYAASHTATTFYAAVSGVYVSDTNKSLDAAGKLQIGDIITKVNNIEVANIYAVMDIINEFSGGDTVSVTFYRGGDYRSVEITLGTETPS